MDADAALFGSHRLKRVPRVPHNLFSFGGRQIARLIHGRNSHPLLVAKSPSKGSTVGPPELASSLVIGSRLRIGVKVSVDDPRGDDGVVELLPNRGKQIRNRRKQTADYNADEPKPGRTHV